MYVRYDSLVTCATCHACAMVAFDVVQRMVVPSLMHYVRNNITDIDDKIIRRAVDNGENDSRTD
jgi:cysteinyl-tRNA synthetase